MSSPEILRRCYNQFNKFNREMKEILKKIGCKQQKYYDEHKFLTYDEWYDEYVFDGYCDQNEEWYDCYDVEGVRNAEVGEAEE